MKEPSLSGGAVHKPRGLEIQESQRGLPFLEVARQLGRKRRQPQPQEPTPVPSRQQQPLLQMVGGATPVSCERLLLLRVGLPRLRAQRQDGGSAGPSQRPQAAVLRLCACALALPWRKCVAAVVQTAESWVLFPALVKSRWEFSSGKELILGGL
jgi:hypothetical protein